MKRLIQHISQVKTLHSLNEFIEERLIINKNYKHIEGLGELFGNINFKHCDKYMLKTRDDIFSTMVNYIRDYNIRSFSDFNSYSNLVKSNNNVYLAVFNKRIKEINIFQKISDDNYKVFVIFKTYPNLYMFKGAIRSFMSMHVLKNCNTWNNTDDVEYYEISEETFNDISELYNKLIKK